MFISDFHRDVIATLRSDVKVALYYLYDKFPFYLYCTHHSIKEHFGVLCYYVVSVLLKVSERGNILDIAILLFM